MFDWLKKKSDNGKRTVRGSVTPPQKTAAGAKMPQNRIDDMTSWPTIALARSVFKTGIEIAEWSLVVDESAPVGARELIEKSVIGAESYIKDVVTSSIVDHGNQPFELIWKYEDGLWSIRRFKPLIQEDTEAAFSDQDEFIGLKQGDIELDAMHSALFSFGGRLGDPAGKPLLRNVDQVWTVVESTLDAQKRYASNVAGGFTQVAYEVGTTDTPEGGIVDNADLAENILKNLRGSGGVTIPFEGDYERRPFRVDHAVISGGSAEFIATLDYYDKLLVRGLLIPERAILESRYGTKADATSHGDYVLLAAEKYANGLAEQATRQFVDKILFANWGNEATGTVRVEPASLTEDKKQFMVDLYNRVLADPGAAIDELAAIDTDAIRDQLGIPERDGGKGIEPVDAAKVAGITRNAGN